MREAWAECRPGRALLDRRAALGLGLGVAAAIARPGLARADDMPAPPRLQNVIDPDAALKRRMDGNKRYVEGVAHRHDFVAERPALVGGQNPFAGILSCADSRVAPEYAFDTGRGDLFVVRVAGNFVNLDNLASFEYAVAVLKTPLIMVLGHEHCGAVSSTIKSVTDGSTLPGHLPSLVKALAPAVTAARKGAGGEADLLERAIDDNVRLNVETLKAATPIVAEAVAKGQIKVVGAVYHLATGKVELVS